MSDEIQQLTYEEALAQLQQIVLELEQGNVPIEQLEAHVKKANELVAYCEQKLKGIEKRLTDTSEA